MKKFSTVSAIIFFAFISNFISAQNTISEDYKRSTIEKLSQLIDDQYVFPEVAKNTTAHLQKQFRDGEFDKYSTDEEFAAALTESVQSINHDKHMRIRTNPPYIAPIHTLEKKMEERMDQINWFRQANSGIKKVEILDGNVGYLDLREFAGFDTDNAYVDAYMKLLSRSDAIIIDLTQNGGGSPFMVQYLCSYFFDQKLHLNSLYYRASDETEEFWTLDEVGGTKMPDIPLFIMTSEQTFSGAEEFSYNMQTLKRATLVGQTTGGGANPGGTIPISDNLTVFIPSGKAINPITKTNWEGTGVVPEVKTSKEETFEKAYDLAKKAAEDNRAAVLNNYNTLYTDFDNKMNQFKPGDAGEAIFETIENLKNQKLIGEWDLNILGYENIQQHNRPELAELLFKFNTELFPKSANAFDSYAESLMMKGDYLASLENYKKAVHLAEESKDFNLEAFKNNLKALETKMKEKD
ncbi:N-terminal domain of Peptidase_S41 [Flavobacteriaceae bacterium MAR_2010_188]|nr:N-terminal domain of Peptidase_S41 [Flavobacteriaceae bacterium MAR_2010_188]